jgi:hypothetical protein
MEKIFVRNAHCGHEFWVTPLNLLQSDVECGICGPQKRAAPLTAWSKSNSQKWQETASDWQRYKSAVTALTEQAYKQHKSTINPENLPRGKAGQQGAYHLDHIVPKRFCFNNGIPAEMCADHRNLQMIGWKENVGSRDTVKGTIPAFLLPYISSHAKLEQHADQLITMFPNAKRFVRVADIVVTVYDEPSNRAIVVLPIDQTYANMKVAIATQRTLLAANINYTILFEDELANNSLIAAKLQHHTHTSQATRIHARDCIIKLCTADEKKVLLQTNHIQGNDVAPIAYGAYYKEALVAVMTFTRPRVVTGHTNNKTSGMWELSRFCTDVRYKIPGIASKLLTHFKRNHQWISIYSFADKRWSTGNLYTKLGFRLMSETPPSYFYVINGKRKHRWNYRKDVLRDVLPNFDPTLTEHQNMVNHGYWRVWDCGALKFVVTNDAVQ